MAAEPLGFGCGAVMAVARVWRMEAGMDRPLLASLSVVVQMGWRLLRALW
jgi:hypothetical protein